MSTTAETHYALTPPERLRAAAGPMVACGDRGEVLRSTTVLDVVTCEGCRRAVESGAVALWEVEAGMIEAKFRRQVAGLRLLLALRVAKVVLVGVAVIAVAAGVWVVVRIWR